MRLSFIKFIAKNNQKTQTAYLFIEGLINLGGYLFEDE
ncbi:Phage protein [Bacillus sp. IT-79MI2]